MTAARSQAPAVVILPGLGNCSADYDALKADLETRSLTARVANVARIDWARNAAGVVDINYWKGTLCPTPTVNWCAVHVEPCACRALQLTACRSWSMRMR